MHYTFCEQALGEIACDCLVLAAGSDGVASGPAREIDQAGDGWLSRLFKQGAIDSRSGKTQLIAAPDGVAARHLLILGAGDDALTPARYRELCDNAGKLLRDRHFSHVVNALPHTAVKGRDSRWTLRQAVLGFDHGSYVYQATRKRAKNAGPGPERVEFHAPQDAASAVDEAAAIATGVRLARELGNLPPNICTPEYLGARAAEIADAHDAVELELLDRAQMQELGMGALLAVAAGSRNEPRLIVLQYRGGADGDAPHALVGKGITFDTGGISIKPGKGMDEMKFDMCGAAGVLGAFLACCELKLPINVVCIVPAVENMPDGAAYRPGDVITSLSGKTIEVLNTDAEGRMILCDALTYVQRFKPASLIDAATLTGACVVALGKHASGLMTRSETLAERLLSAGTAVHDRAWRLPLWDEYHSQLDTPFADFSNLGGPGGGSITAGCFLSKFVEDVEWAHLDVAGTAWEDNRGGATGRPVGILTQYLIDRCNG